ncbi:lipopolysaccharide biosynthesis protein [Streptomyces alfalfae]|uniref:Lipopolysaccharide biosynthesis protein n=1 Tax=Streptomyces alfalfae TaxID=1642299 RepID=A0A1P8THT2_9ACTN|nr:lipopolysaccharide biosynthesis protein [Streptomyces alfalfae]APY87201.1 lipopolysaccharide biosynthesis protein [Streptomyces alfalfae]QQC90503.1 lipopolysaccharide biosynthesis protein [Streptomyces alfalfae]QUI32982.1 lipopolysaccharide biosynthesis protein [Streptomyces alfalfae]
MSDPVTKRPRLDALRARLDPLRARAARLPRWTALPACALVGLLAGTGYGVLKTPRYTATSYVLAVPQGKSDPATALGYAQAYGRVAKQLAVIGDAQVAAGMSPTGLRDSIQVATSPDAPMIAISASAARPSTAAITANAVARALSTGANHSKDSTQVKLLPFSRALDPAEPSSLSPGVTALVGGCAGGLLGGLALLVRPRARTEPAPGASVPGPASVLARSAP